MKWFLFVIATICGTVLLAQQDKKTYRKNQHRLDQNYGGIGVSIMQPDFGNGVSIPKNWYGVSIVSDFFESDFIMGEVNKIQPKPLGDDFEYPVGDYGKDFGYMLTAGVSFPLNFFTFGAYRNPYNMLRGHPVIGTNFGYGSFKRSSSANGKTNLYYWGLNVGYRVRFPIGSVEFGLKGRLGISSVDDFAGTGYDFYKGIGISPTITFRLDAMKGLLNPRMVSVAYTQATISNLESETRRTGTRYSGNTRIETYTTTTTGTVNVTSGNMGVQDIGPYFGIGPKVSFMNPIRSTHIEPGYLVGIVAEGRASTFDFGVTLEGGNVGHGSVLEYKGENEPRRKLDKSESEAIGTVSMVNLYTNVGIDISPVFFIPFGIAMDKGESTSFFGATAGFVLGGHLAFNQQFNDPSLANYYQNIAQTSTPGLDDKYVDPSRVSPGFLGGFYFSVQVGAASFKITNYRYYGAPFASTTMLSVAWRFSGVSD